MSSGGGPTPGGGTDGDRRSAKRSGTPLLALLALGVIYGDIGTSPLYAIREAFSGAHGVAVSRASVLGVLSLVTWSLVLVISVKYLAFILRADNRGEGGILALMALVHPEHRAGGAPLKGARGALVLAGLFGAALLYGDGMLTPAISVLGAMEGLSVATHAFEPFVVPVSVGVLVGLFLVQRRGTARVGAVFGPVMLVWFAVIATLGVRGVLMAPEVLGALDPRHAAAFLRERGGEAFLVLGAVFLVVTGGEALYADMGHFGRTPIRLGWFTIVLPALLLNYYGQGALVLSNPEAVRSPFYLLAPAWALYPLVVLATAAAIIASQAVISGAYSLTMQAVHLGYCPRLRIEHTSATERGQIYMPEVNWALLVGTVFLVLTFRSSSAIAGAYGLAVSATMVVTTLLFAVVAREVWGWRWWLLGLVGVFLAIDVAFLAANVPKIPQGGYFPLVVGAVAIALMTTWRKGRQILGRLLAQSKVPLKDFIDEVGAKRPMRVPGTAVFPTGNPHVVPPALQRTLDHYKVLHEQVVILHVASEEDAYVGDEDRLEHVALGEGFHRVVARYGFMEQPSVPDVMVWAVSRGLAFDPADTTYFLGRERLIPTRRPSGMAFWREKLFAFMTRNAQPATAYFRIPPERVVEVGAQVKLELPARPSRP